MSLNLRSTMFIKDAIERFYFCYANLNVLILLSFATVSHEIRTPMNVVLGMLDMLLDMDLNLTQKDYAQTAQVCGKALISLINEVLDRAKIEAGKLEIEAVPFELRSILDDVLSLFSSKSREKGIEFTEHGHIFVKVHLAEHLNIVMDTKVTGLNGRSDEAEIPSNGIAFNPLSGLEAADNRNSWETFRLLLSDEPSSPAAENRMPNDTDSDKVILTISIEDTGIGIPLHAQDQVFTPFMWADSSTSRNYGGTGIGLSISRCLVELVGGQIDFTSQPHIGSTFTFTTVLQRCEETTSMDLKKAPSEALPACFKGMKALLVDGKPVRGAVTKYQLQRLGITLEVASTVKMALCMLSGQNGCSRSGYKKQPCMVLIEKEYWSAEMDVHLHDQLLDLKQTGQITEVPKVILLVTSESEKAKVGSFIDIVIMKPLRASTVAACLQQAFGIGKPQRKAMPNGSALLNGILAGKNILVVDDNKANLRVAAGALKKYGANVECAESENGSGNNEWHLPILAMTADVIQVTCANCTKCGMDGCVQAL